MDKQKMPESGEIERCVICGNRVNTPLDRCG